MGTPFDYLELAQNLSSAVKKALVKDLRSQARFDVRASNSSTKAVHEIDALARDIALEQLQGVPCNIYMESFEAHLEPEACFSLFIDPVDGSINWDRAVGDPCFALAISPKTEAICFKDFDFAYLEGFRSGDCYYTQEGQAWHYHAMTGLRRPVQSSATTELSTAHAYLKTGYSGAAEQFHESFPLFLQVKDIRAIDNSGMELCELARGATDLMVEGRKLSDFYNLLAYPILNASGVVISDLQGNLLGPQLIQPTALYDFVAAANSVLWQACLESLAQFRAKGKYAQDGVVFRRKSKPA